MGPARGRERQKGTGVREKGNTADNVGNVHTGFFLNNAHIPPPSKKQNHRPH
jgi:hypothetical protein